MPDKDRNRNRKFIEIEIEMKTEKLQKPGYVEIENSRKEKGRLRFWAQKETFGFWFEKKKGRLRFRAQKETFGFWKVSKTVPLLCITNKRFSKVMPKLKIFGKNAMAIWPRRLPL